MNDFEVCNYFSVDVYVCVTTCSSSSQGHFSNVHEAEWRVDGQEEVKVKKKATQGSVCFFHCQHNCMYMNMYM